MNWRRITLGIFKRLSDKFRPPGYGAASPVASAAHLSLGALGERLAADLLERAGYRLVAPTSSCLSGAMSRRDGAGRDRSSSIRRRHAPLRRGEDAALGRLRRARG
jgi:hypothetical protein